MKVGLTGGLASGKTFVGLELAALGCHLIRADELGHEALAPDGAVFSAVVKEFGPEILTNGSIDRGVLARQVFGNPGRLEALNRLIHPFVRSRQIALTLEILARDATAIVVYEAAILIETGGYRELEKLIVVYCTMEQQIERAMHRGASRDDVIARLSHQMPLEDKRKFADYVIDTSGAKEATREQTLRVYDSLRSLV